MCGISVLFNKNNITKETYKDFLNSLRKINHRGPDDEGVVLINTTNGNYKIARTDKTHTEVCNTTPLNEINLNDYNLIFGHKRLSILDLSVNGHQPMHYLNYTIVFNGEIYNYIEIRDELVTYGYKFKTNSDTEVILAAYDKWKEMCLNKFNGMFSIIIYDNVENYLFIANDRFGVKPLYYYKDKNSLIFASEIKQFYSLKLSLSINTEAIETFATTGFIDYNNETFYNEIQRFPKASFS
jgi:asparagine synthase (glutamine-hydrolysing)